MSFTFDGFTLDASGFRLLHEGREIPLERRAFDLLYYLAQHHERVVSKDELLEQVWRARVLSDGVLSNTIAKLRKALNQSADQRKPIETVHGRGYRFHMPGPASQAPAPDATSELSANRRGHADDPFVGREPLMANLLQRLERRVRGSENLVVLAGDAGIGKTRVTRELSALARQRGSAVWSGASHEAGGAPPYWPWTQILRQAYEELTEPVFRDCLPQRASAIAQLLPELFPLEATAPIEPQLARFRLFEQMAAFFKAACAQRPLLLVLDDLQCADPGSVELLAFVARALSEQPLMCLATLRTGQAPAAVPESSPLERLARVATVVSMTPLSPEQVAQLLLACTGDERPELARALHERTQGNPLFVRQMLELSMLRGDLSLLQEGLVGAHVPPAVSQIIRTRLVGLPDGTRRALAAASVVGKSFDTALLAQVMDIDQRTLLDHLQPALDVGILEQGRDALDGLSFQHGLVRDSLYEQLSIGERGELHARVADALTRRERHPARLTALAHHSLLALPFRLPECMEACRAAARAAQEAAGFEAAAELLSRAIRKLDSEGGPLETRTALLLELGEDQFYAGSIVSAWNAFRDACESARHQERVDLLAEVVPRLVDCLELGVGEPRVARSYVEHALAGAHQLPEALRASLLAQRAELAIELSSQARFQLLDEAAQLATNSQIPDAVLEVAHSRAILRDPTQLQDNARAAQAFLELTESFPDAAASMRYRSLRRFGAYLTKYLCALTSCDLPLADAALEVCRNIADSSHVRAARFAVELMSAGRALADGRLADLKRIAANLGSRVHTELPTEGYAWISYLGSLLEAQGMLEAVSNLNLDSLSTAAATMAKHSVYASIGRARLYVLTGQLERARAVTAELADVELARMPVQYGDLGALCSLVDVSLALSDLPFAERLHGVLTPHAHLNAVGPCFEYRGSVAHYLGRTARALGRETEARERFRQAVEVNRRLGMPRELSLSAHELHA